MSSDYYCKMCDITCSGKAPYDQHLDSAKHLKRAKTYVGQPSPEPTASSNTNASVPSFTKDLSPPPSVPPASTTGSLSADTMRVLLEWNHPLGYHPYCEICYLPLHGEGNADLHFSPKNLIHQQKLAARKQIRETVPNYSCKVCSEVFPSETVMLQHFHSEIHTTTTQLKSSLEKFILVYDTYQKLKEARRNGIEEENTVENQFNKLQIIDPSETTPKAKKKAASIDLLRLNEVMKKCLNDDSD